MSKALKNKVKLNDMVSVTDYGADPTGVADSTTAIQNALNTGKDVLLPVGTFKLTTALAYFSAGQAIFGTGPNSILNQTGVGVLVLTATNLNDVCLHDVCIKPSPSHTSNSGAGRNDGVKFITCDRVSVTNVKVDYSGCSAVHSGIWFDNCNYADVRGNWFYSAPNTNGVYFLEGGDDITFNGNCSYNVIQGNRCVSGQVTGIQFSSLSGVSVGNVINGNVVYGCSGYGIIAYKTNVAATFRDLTITGNHVENITGGVLSDGPSPSTVRKFGAGIYLQGINDCTVVGNTVRNVAQQTNNSTLAIASISGTQVSATVTGNQCIQSGTQGIFFSGFPAGGAYPDPSDSGIVIANNVVKLAVTDGIFVNQARRAVITGNSVLRTATATSGSAIITLTDGVVLPDLIVSNNNINATAASALTGINIGYANTLECHGNTVLGTSTAISIFSATKVNIQGNTIKTATGFGITYDSVTTAGVVAGNHVDSATVAGIRSNGYAKVVNNTFVSCGADNTGTYSQWTNAAPASGTWRVGDAVEQSIPTVGQPKRWRCIATGTTGATLSSVVITGTAGQFSCTAASLTVGVPVIISGTFGGTGSITGYANPTTYYIIATNGSTTFTLSSTYGGSAITTTAGTPTGLTYTTNNWVSEGNL